MEKELDFKLITRHICSLPLCLKREFGKPIERNAQIIINKKCMEELFTYLDMNLWNFIDYTLLEYIIMRYGSPAIQQEMKDYVSELFDFQKKTTIAELIENWPGRKHIPPTYCNASAKIDLNPKECTLYHLNKIRIELAEKFLPTLSDFAMILCNFSRSSIIVGWAIALDLVPALTNKICEPESSSFFETRLIVSFSIRGIQVYPLPRHRSLELEGDKTTISIGIMTRFIVSMQKAPMS